MNTPHDHHHEDTGDFETTEQEHHTNLANITWELEDLCHRVKAGEGQPAEAVNNIECELQRLSITLCPSAPPEPLDNVLRQYTDILCSAQRQTNFTDTLLQDITIFTGYDATQKIGC